ncbi:MAG: pantetheine-phosphate adenylyltransferase [Dehalococcoidales bacterium]|nr:pantetheine-phosphate adenylyltransferase [Dehalococcoidales bacterium]
MEKKSSTQQSIAVYAGTFDPVTYGHLWMIERGSKLFNSLIVAVGTNPDKAPHFTTEERVRMIEDVTSGYSNVTVDHYPNQFLIKYAESMDAKFILRGIRSTADYEYEKSISYVNRYLNSDIETVFLLPPREMIEISSSVVRGLIGPPGWEVVVGKYVPPMILERLIEEQNKLIRTVDPRD